MLVVIHIYYIYFSSKKKGCAPMYMASHTKSAWLSAAHALEYTILLAYMYVYFIRGGIEPKNAGLWCWLNVIYIIYRYILHAKHAKRNKSLDSEKKSSRVKRDRKRLYPITILRSWKWVCVFLLAVAMLVYFQRILLYRL